MQDLIWEVLRHLFFRALVEATAYGSKAIVDRFIENGVEIKVTSVVLP